jgi:hypothetical protein
MVKKLGVNMDISNNIQNIQLAMQSIAQWGRTPMPASPNSEDAAVLTRLATSVFNLTQVPVAEIPLTQRVQIREILLSGLNSAFMPNSMQRLEAAVQCIADSGQRNMIAHSGENNAALVDAIDRWSVEHFREDEPQWAALSPEELASHRETYLKYARGYLENVLVSADVLQRLKSEPETRASWTVRLRALIEKFPELRDDLPPTRTLDLLDKEHATYDPATAKEFLALGAPVISSFLFFASQANDFELLDTLIRRYEQEPSRAKLQHACGLSGMDDLFFYTVMSIKELPDADGVRILNRLIQMCKDNRLPLCEGDLVLFTLFEMIEEGRNLYETVVLDMVSITSPAACSNNGSLCAKISAFYAKTITACLPSSPHADVPRALRLCQQVETFTQQVPIYRRNNVMDIVLPAITALRGELLSQFEDPERCGPFLDSLGDAMPLLFQFDPSFGKSLERDGTPLIKWLQGNNWWRDHDANWFFAEMTREEVGTRRTHLQGAGAAKAFDLLLTMPANVLRAGMSHVNVDGSTPFVFLISNG